MKIISMSKKCLTVFLALMCFFSVSASEKDLTIKFMLDTSGSMKAQDIALTSSSILAAEISDFIRNASFLFKDSSLRILVDSFWQKDNALQTQAVFDYRLGQSGIPNYDGLRDLKTKWFVDDETTLNKFVNRNWPAENKNTILVVLTNSQETLEYGELTEINKDAQKVNSKLIIVILPRKNNYNESSLKAEIAKRIHGSTDDVKAHLLTKQFKMVIEVSVNGKKVNPARRITAIAPTKIDMSAYVSEDGKINWKYKGVEKSEKHISLNVENAEDFTVTAVGIDGAGNTHPQEIAFNILPIPKAAAKFSFFPVSGTAPLTISTTNKSANAQKYQWNWGDGTPESNDREPNHTYQKPGTYTITLNILGENGDVVSGKQQISVTYSAPVAKFTAPFSASTEKAVEFTDNSQNVSRWSWNFGDGTASSEKNPKHRFTKAGNYTVVLQVSNPNGLTAQTSANIKISEKLVAAFEYDQPSKDSPKVSFRNLSKGAVKYNWDFGDGQNSTEESPTHLFAIRATKRFTVSLTVVAENGQSVTAKELIRVTASEEKPKKSVIADFTYEKIQDAEKPTFKFTNKSRGAKKYKWDFGDDNTSTENSPQNVYENITEEKTFTVTLVATAPNGMKDTKYVEIKVAPVSSGGGFGVILVIILILAAGGIFVAVKCLSKKTFTVHFNDCGKKTKDWVCAGKELEIIKGDLSLKIEKDKDGKFKVAFQKQPGSQVEVKQNEEEISIPEDDWSELRKISKFSINADATLKIEEGKK